MVESTLLSRHYRRVLMMILTRSKPATDIRLQGSDAPPTFWGLSVASGGRPIPFVELHRGRLNSQVFQEPRQGVQAFEESWRTSLRGEG